jgi:hypothetical protein
MKVDLLSDRSNVFISFAERLAHEPHKVFSAPAREKTQLADTVAKRFPEAGQDQRQGGPSSALPVCVLRGEPRGRATASARRGRHGQSSIQSINQSINTDQPREPVVPVIAE